MPARTKHKVAANAEAIAAHVRRIDDDAPAVQREWRVTGVPGLSLVRTSGGAWSYHLRFQAGSGSRRRSVRQAIGRANGPTAIKLAVAKAKALKIATEGPQGFGDDGDKAMTLRQLFELFEKSDRDRAPRTMSDYREAMERGVFKTLGDVPVNEITAKDIAKLLTKIESRSRNAAHKCRAALGSLYKWATKRLLVDANIMVGMGFAHTAEPRDRFPTGDEIAKLWRAIDSEAFGTAPSVKFILKLAILTGQRNSEVAGARRDELKIGATVANPLWQIPRSRMKRKRGNRDQFVFLSDQARTLFAEALELAGDSEYVFPATARGRRVKGAQESVSKAWARLRRIAGVEGVHLHDTRKSITSWLGERGERSDVLDRIMDHAIGHHSNQRNSVTESHYNFATMAGPLRDAWQRWADHVEAIGAGDKAGAGANVVAMVRA